jgi:hypothetical protein
MQMRGWYANIRSVAAPIGKQPVAERKKPRKPAKPKKPSKGRGGLGRWFDEKWVDIKTGKSCGRSKGEKRDYPACRPSRRVSDKTPKTTGEMSSGEKARFKREKTGSKKISYQHRRRKAKKKKS